MSKTFYDLRDPNGVIKATFNEAAANKLLVGGKWRHYESDHGEGVAFVYEQANAFTTNRKSVGELQHVYIWEGDCLVPRAVH